MKIHTQTLSIGKNARIKLSAANKGAMNLLNVAKNFATEDQALDHLIKSRWPEGVRCLACQNPKVYTISTKGKTEQALPIV